LSALICSGQITREEALEEISKPPATKEVLNNDREYVVKKLGISEEEFDKILKAPNKSYLDYPNNEAIWKRFNKIIQIARKRITRVD
jgi:hypothetical protein